MDGSLRNSQQPERSIRSHRLKSGSKGTAEHLGIQRLHGSPATANSRDGRSDRTASRAAAKQQQPGGGCRGAPHLTSAALSATLAVAVLLLLLLSVLRGARLAVEHAVLEEHLERVGIEHLDLVLALLGDLQSRAAQQTPTNVNY